MKVFFILLLAITGMAQSKNSALHKLFDEHWEYRMRSNPTWATNLADHRYDDKLDDLSEEEFHRSIDTTKKYLNRLHTIDTAILSHIDKISYLLFENDLKNELEGAKFLPYTMPIAQQNGIQVDFPQLVNSHPFKTKKDYDNFIARLHGFPKQVNDVIANMRTGIAKGLVPPHVTLEHVPPQIEAQIVEAEKSVLYEPFTKIPSSISAKDKALLQRNGKKILEEDVLPGFKKLLIFVRDEYLPKCRASVGISALPDGKERYRFAVHHHTTTTLTPEEIYEIGKREIARIHGEMEKIKTKVGFTGTLQDFFSYLRTDKKFYYTTGDSLVAAHRAILKKMDNLLPKLFGHLPYAKYDLKKIEPYREQSAPDAYYYSGAPDGSRPGIFYVNTYRLDMRPKYLMEALAYHEAVPGHHLQISVAQELTDLPKFRREGGYTAFVEGWGLYSERLPKEVGCYADDYSEFGRQTFDAWRACRLIIDTGIHFFGWTREQAIEFMKQNTALAEVNIVSEIERYISWPGQACAYKIGQLKILELREKAQKELGAKFDIRAFHDHLLGDGALPLDVLETSMKEWVREEKKK